MSVERDAVEGVIPAKEPLVRQVHRSGPDAFGHRDNRRTGRKQSGALITTRPGRGQIDPRDRSIGDALRVRRARSLHRHCRRGRDGPRPSRRQRPALNRGVTDMGAVGRQDRPARAGQSMASLNLRPGAWADRSALPENRRWREDVLPALVFS